jgi:type I restriction enzyme, R subunit
VENYPEDYFSHIVIDECHRSGFGKWAAVLKRNPNAVQIGLTATPRKIKLNEHNADTEEDEQISADNYLHFGEPVYEYDFLQAVEDGYLSACEIQQNHILLLGEDENKGLLKQQLTNAQVKNYFSGQDLSPEALKEKYHAVDLDNQIILPERTLALALSLFNYLLETGKPEQKTIIFCAGVDHARRVAIALTNLYSVWCQQNGQDCLDKFAFPCTGEVGKDNLTDFKEAKRSHFIATTADLLQAGVDVPWVRHRIFYLPKIRDSLLSNDRTRHTLTPRNRQN